MKTLNKELLNKAVQTEFFKYGFLPMLICMERFLYREQYELCESILYNIKKLNTKYDLDIPAKISPQAVVNMKLSFMINFNLSGDVAYKNSEYYANEIELSLFKFLQKIKRA